MKIKYLVLSALFLAGCASQPTQQQTTQQKYTPLIQAPPSRLLTSNNDSDNWSIFTEDAASHYGVDERLISAIISVESGGNPDAVSRSDAIGLMQIKASTAGREVYRVQGKRGQPTRRELQDPAKNIQIGTAYIKILQKTMLSGIRNPVTMRYATIVSYSNGAGALLRTFSPDRERAIAMINGMTPQQFYRYIERRHPAAQAPRYLWKVTTAYQDS
ncbi:transglycosylase SLT domain-containing protein [Tatumella saanichensis]|uniref:transglycosylase SLT domain-containing protein n=1 Tax=Tatumella saanichensis TaxID=480813 RepID=UPI0004A2859B|nr:transglycosylase SLT domain-containing protein [Tatumella saanichensis]